MCSQVTDFWSVLHKSLTFGTFYQELQLVQEELQTFTEQARPDASKKKCASASAGGGGGRGGGAKGGEGGEGGGKAAGSKEKRTGSRRRI